MDGAYGRPIGANSALPGGVYQDYPQEDTIMAFFNRKTEVIPASAPSAGGSIATRIGAGVTPMIDRATQVYRNNPKAIGAAALVGSALLLGFLKKRGTR